MPHDFLPISDCHSLGFSATDYQNFRRRYPNLLQTDYPPTSPGRSQLLSPENALELAVVSALVKCKVKAEGAVQMAAGLVRNFRNRKNSMHRPIEYVVFAAASPGQTDVGKRGASLKEMSQAALAEIALSEGPALSVICVGQIRRTVEHVFELD